jgi:anti-repressor protein
MKEDLFEEQVEQEVQRRMKEELEKIASNPKLVIAAYKKSLEQAEEEIRAAQPKVDFYNSVTISEDWMEMSTAVKSMEWAGKPIGRNKMFDILRDRGILRSGTFNKNEPYQKYVDLGYFRIVETKWDNKEGEVFIGRKTVVSQKGLDFIKKLVKEAYNE